MKTIIAIDPGTNESALVKWSGGKLYDAVIMPNEALLSFVRGAVTADFINSIGFAVEMVACYGMPVGKEVFETCLIVGRIQEIVISHQHKINLIYRREVKIHHCGSMKAKDANIRQALIDKYGEPGTKKNPGKTYGLKSHLWSAFAIATYLSETNAT